MDANTTIDNYQLKASDGYPPLYLYDYRISRGSTIIATGGAPMEGQHSDVSGISKKIQIVVTPISGDPETIHSYSASP